jgi:hypothetical protein
MISFAGLAWGAVQAAASLPAAGGVAATAAALGAVVAAYVGSSGLLLGAGGRPGGRLNGNGAGGGGGGVLPASIGPTVHLVLVALTLGMVLKWPLTSVLFLACWAGIVARTPFVSTLVGHVVAARAGGGGGGGAPMEPTAQEVACRALWALDELLEAASSSLSPEAAASRAASAAQCANLALRDWFATRPWTVLALALAGTWVACAALASVVEDAGRLARRQFRGSVRLAARSLARSARFVVWDVWVRLLASVLRAAASALRLVAGAIASLGRPREPRIGARGGEGWEPARRRYAPIIDDDEEPAEDEDYDEDQDEDYVPDPLAGDEEDDDEGEDDVPYEYDDEEDDPRLLLEDLDDGAYEPPASPPRMSARLLGRAYYGGRR